MDSTASTEPQTTNGAVASRDRFLGCLLGGAVGDALGAAVEFESRAEILETFGPDGITDYAPIYGGLGRIIDDTQITLFTAEGCGGVMRVAPVGLLHWSTREYHLARDTSGLGCQLAALTHGHPTGQLTAGVC